MPRLLPWKPLAVALLGLAAVPWGRLPAEERIASAQDGCAGEHPAKRHPGYGLIDEGSGTWTGINAAQRVRLRFSADGVRITPLDSGRPLWRWELTPALHGGPQEERAAAETLTRASEELFELLRGPIHEWFVSGPQGVEHGIEVSAFEDPQAFTLEFAHGGSLTPKVADDGRTVRFLDASGAAVLVGRGLRAQDAAGRDVGARWERIEASDGRKGALRLVVEGAEHAYPINIIEFLVTPKGLSDRAGEGAAGAGGAAGGPTTLLAPDNDLCAGAEPIPAAGPFPYLSGSYDIADAGTLDDPPLPACQDNLSRSIWFRFTPAAGGSYALSLCGDGDTSTTVEDTVLAVYAGSGDCSGFVEEPGGCDDDSCAAGDLQSVIPHIDLNAGATYYIVVWQYGTAPPAPGAGAVQLRVAQNPPSPGPPPNDRCGGAEVIPGAGPFPSLTSVTADVSGATSTGDPDPPSCQPNVSRSVWYSFTPVRSGRYTFSACADAPTGTTADDTVLAVYTGTGPCSGLVQVAGACDDDSCLGEAAQSVIRGTGLEAGRTYSIVVWQYGLSPPAPGDTAVQLRVSEEVAPPNDACGAAPALLLDHPIAGTTAAATDDYQLPAPSACYAGIGQTASTAAGRDVAYAFAAPRAGRYSFRVTGFETAKNAVLYVATDCPAGAGPATIAGCLGAANRNAGYPGEEVECLPLAAGEAVYAYVDEAALTSGSAFAVEVNECVPETEPNGLPEAATSPACGMEGSIVPAGDADFFALGVPDAGSRVFALVDGAAANSTDFDLRVTTTADTLEFDDLNNDVPFGSVAPNVSGAPLAGAPSYLRISHYNAAAQAEPYRLYTAVQPPAAAATHEAEPNNTPADAGSGSNLYFAGALSDSGDVDVFAFAAAEGDLVLLGLDLDPTRDNTPFNGSLALLDASGSILLLASDGGSTSSTTPGTASLSAASPQSPAEAIAYRARSTGTYYARVAWSGGIPGDYLLSIAHHCRISPPTDLAVDLADTPDPVVPGGALTYTARVRNLGAHPASVVALSLEPPEGSSLTSIVTDQGVCAGAGPVVCHLGTIAAGAQVRVEALLTAPAAPGTATAAARVSTVVIDSNPADDATAVTTAVQVAADADGDGIPDASDCAPADPTAWSVPGEAGNLALTGGAGTTLLQWSAPADPGGSAVVYDVLRSAMAGDFTSPSCVAADSPGTAAGDAVTAPGISYYLVRAENSCGGNLGARSDGTLRVGGACP